MYDFTEAFELLKEAEKACVSKTTLFFMKKKPDWCSAAYNFDKAANMFKAGNNSEHAVECYIKAAEAYNNSDSIYLAAKSLENAAQILEKDNKFEEACKRYKQASNCYLEGNSPDKAGDILLKAGMVAENYDINIAIECYINACDLMDNEERGKLSVDIYKKAILALLKLKKINEAVNLSSRLNKVYQDDGNSRTPLAKNQLSIIIILLSTGDEISANKYYDEFCSTGFPTTEEGITAGELLDAFEQCNQEMVDKCTSKFVVKYLDNEIARLAKTLKVVGAVAYQPEANYDNQQQQNYQNYSNNYNQTNNYNNNNPNQGYNEYPQQNFEDDDGIC